MKRLLLWISLFVLFSSLANADEGMWLYNAFPKDKVQTKYHFEPSQGWLDHVRLSSVRFNNGGSGSFVSANGLTFTNHHVGAECIQQLSTGGKDYIKSGFYAATQADEARCPSLELNQLVSIEDVSARVHDAVKPGMSSAASGQAERSAMSSVEKECTASTGLRCDVITFYSGAVYHLYRYKKYTDVRLVFAPEFDMAFFGGDPDNFTYPRYDLDVTFFRVYEDGKPAHIEHFLKWTNKGVKDGDLIFVSGNPGSTARLKTMSQLEYFRDVDYPSRFENYKRRIKLLQGFASQSEENARISKEDLFSYQNALKAFTGYQQALLDKSVMEKKSSDEERLHSDFAADSKNAGSDPWANIAQAMKVQREIYLPLTYVERLRGYNSELAQFARWIVRGATERTRPNELRQREFRDSALPSLEQELFSAAPIYKNFEIVKLTDSISQMEQSLGSSNASLQASLGGKSAADAARELITNSKLDDVGYRRQLWEGGKAAVDASTDPLIVLMRNIDDEARAVRKNYEDNVEAVERREGAAIAKARFAQHGFTDPPDATFTIRLSYGQVGGYEENGEKIPYFTPIGGAFEHAEKNGNKPPYQLPDSWMKAKSKLKLKTPLNFVSTADIIGGNSGSPTIDRAGELVGIIFDGNIQSLAWNFAYTDTQARAVSVDARGIQEALRTVYGASRLADELTKGTGGSK